MSGLPDTIKLNFVESLEDVLAFKRWLGERRSVLGVDTETTGFSPETDKIRLIQFGDTREGWALPWEDWRGVAKEVFTEYEGDFVLHNSKFDIRHIQADLGLSVSQWPWHRTHDTMGMAHILDSQRPKSLKTLASMHIDGRAASGEKTLHDGMGANGWSWETVPIDFPPYWQYGALDPVLTAFLFEKFHPEMKSSYSELYDLEMGAIRVAAKMEELGVRVDLAYSEKKAKELTDYGTAVRQWLTEQWGIENPTSTALVRFFTSHNVPLIEKYTDSGNQAMDKHVLETTKHPVAEAVLKMRKAEKLAGTYLENFPKFADSDGFLHPNIMTMAARTGRMSITNPALQTLPRKDPTVRDAFIPREDHSLLTIDADQIEARLTAHFSQDAGLIGAFGNDDDFFCTVASQAFGYPVVKGMQERDLIKGVVYGKVYGAAVTKMAEAAGVPVSQMEVTNAAFDTNFPGVRRMMKSIVDVGKNRKAVEGRGYVITPYGRKLACDSGKEYTLVNYLIQCHASEILKKKMVMLDAALPEEVKMILPVHDEIIFDVPTDIVEDVKREAEAVLNESSEYLVPITWSGDILHESWGEKYHK